MPSNLPTFDEHRWVIQIRRTLDEELEEDTEINVSIFNVPTTLISDCPDYYIPQQVALGPYHHLRPELYEMERYKLAAAKRTQKQQIRCFKFPHLVDQLTKLEPRIRACYHKYLNYNGETLAWMMAVDASFLLEFLEIFAAKEGGKILTRVSSRMSHLVDVAGRKSAHNAILRDIIMLENQIPLFLLRKMLEFKFSSLELADNSLVSMLAGLCEALCPFEITCNMEAATERAHLLDFLYHVIVPEMDVQDQSSSEMDGQDRNEGGNEEGKEEQSFGKPIHVKQLFRETLNLVVNLNHKLVRVLRRGLWSKPIRVAFRLPWTIISNLPGVRILTQAFCQCGEEEEDTPLENGKNMNKPPLIEEITIPSITELFKAGVNFVPTNNSISTISFDSKTVSLYLPVISLDVNAEVILRNLVAYEACNASGPLVFTRYTELMNGIIDTEEDAKLLRERGIVLNRLKSDQEVANLWNGMTRSVRLTRVPFLDEVIEDVNRYYNGRWKVKAGKFMKLYVFGSWQVLTLLAAILLLLLMTFQAFCSVYSCSRVFRIKTI